MSRIMRVLTIALVVMSVGLVGATAAEATPGNNQTQNKQFRDAVRDCNRAVGYSISKDMERQLHRAISKQNFSFRDIVDECVVMFRDRKPKNRPGGTSASRRAVPRAAATAAVVAVAVAKSPAKVAVVVVGTAPKDPKKNCPRESRDRRGNCVA